MSLMRQTHGHNINDDTEGPPSAFFGAVTRNRGILHRVRGSLIMARHPTDLHIHLSVNSGRAPAGQRPPPRSYKPVSQLVEASGVLFGPIEVNCHAIFEYDQKQGYRSRISLPVPLINPEEADGITHIESAQFSRRDKDKIDYQIIVVKNDESETLTHSVIFESTLELNLVSVKGLVRRARQISTQLLA